MEKKFTEEFVVINKIEQYLLHYKKEKADRVILVVHGGPGAQEHELAYVLEEALEKELKESFNLVYYDQRGAGMTLKKMGKYGKAESVNELVLDLHAVVKYIKKKYNTDKVIIIGHSFGTILGSLYALRYPENVEAYIGTGQMVSTVQNERKAYELTFEYAKKNNDEKLIKKLEKFESYPPESKSAFMTQMKKLHKIIASNVSGQESSSGIMKKMKASPCKYKTGIFTVLKASLYNEKLVKQVLDFDLNISSADYMVPVHYILGASDYTTPACVTKEYFEKITAPEKSINLIEGAGHNCLYEKPQEFAKLLKKVINS